MTLPRIAVVLPAHNEEALLEATVRQVAEGLKERGETYELIVVENGSSDRTPALAAALSADDPAIRVVALPEADYGRAIAAGLASATAPVVVLFDVDYFDLGFLDRAVSLVRAGDAGIVLASKRAPGSVDRRPMLRRLLTAVFTVAMRAALRVPVSDAHGMKALSAAVCRDVASRCRMGGSLFDVELVARAARSGIGIGELPVEVKELRPPRTPVLRRSLEGAVGLVRLRMLLRREARGGP
ncbi:MAG: glycosyltransferase family 2 protein [Acidimicrobiales bacterium]